MTRKQNKKPVTFTETEYMMFLGSGIRNFTKKQRNAMNARQHREMREWARA